MVCGLMAIMSCLQYTFILPASKRLPSQVVDPWKGTTKHRSTVGVRWPKEPVCQVCPHTACVQTSLDLPFRHPP